MSKRKFRTNTLAYLVGEDFTKEEYDRWIAEIALWLSETQSKEKDPKGKAKHIVDCAVTGTKLNGEIWIGAEHYSLDKRIKQFCNWDIINQVGSRRSSVGRKAKYNKLKAEARRITKENNETMSSISLAERIARREKFKTILFEEFPFLDNPVYETKVNAYVDTEVQLEALSERFIAADDSALAKIMELRDGLKKDLDDFMKILRIHPSQIKEKVEEGDKGDVGSLIVRWEEYGEVAELYEQVDAIQEAIQIIRQLENLRVDGSPQLSDWLLWHKTGCRGHSFTCECGNEYELYGGFTKKEMYEIVEQAHKVFGYGLEHEKAEV